jgi:hypothetical protein
MQSFCSERPEICWKQTSIIPGFEGSPALSVQGGEEKLDEFDTLKVWANMLIL